MRDYQENPHKKANSDDIFQFLEKNACRENGGKVGKKCFNIEMISPDETSSWQLNYICTPGAFSYLL